MVAGRAASSQVDEIHGDRCRSTCPSAPPESLGIPQPLPPAWGPIIVHGSWFCQSRIALRSRPPTRHPRCSGPTLAVRDRPSICQGIECRPSTTILCRVSVAVRTRGLPRHHSASRRFPGKLRPSRSGRREGTTGACLGSAIDERPGECCRHASTAGTRAQSQDGSGDAASRTLPTRAADVNTASEFRPADTDPGENLSAASEPQEINARGDAGAADGVRDGGRPAIL